MSELDETHNADQTRRTSRLGNAHKEWLDNLTTSEADAYRQGRREAALEHQKYVRAYVSYQRVLKKIARGELHDPAAAASFILHEPDEDAS